METKGEKREAKRNKEFNARTMGVRTPTLRAGEGLVAFEVKRKSKPPKRRKK